MTSFFRPARFCDTNRIGRERSEVGREQTCLSLDPFGRAAYDGARLRARERRRQTVARRKKKSGLTAVAIILGRLAARAEARAQQAKKTAKKTGRVRFSLMRSPVRRSARR